MGVVVLWRMQKLIMNVTLTQHFFPLQPPLRLKHDVLQVTLVFSSLLELLFSLFLTGASIVSAPLQPLCPPPSLSVPICLSRLSKLSIWILLK